MAFAREIFQQIKNHIRFQQAEKEKDSHYTILGSTLVRISNHCTYMKVWENYFEKNPKYEGMKIVSIVFEDKGSTFTKQCLQLINRRDNPIVVGEYVYHSASLSKLEIKSIIKSLQEMDYSNTYKDATKKCLFYPRLSVNPPPPYKVPDKIAQHIGNDLFNKLRNYREWNGITTEKIDRKMSKKNTIKLTESDLKRVISESVKRVLKESRDESFYYDLRDEMISTRDFVFEKYSKLSKNGVITLGQLDGALQSLGGTLLNTACNLHDKLPANYGYGSPDYERIGY